MADGVPDDVRDVLVHQRVCDLPAAPGATIVLVALVAFVALTAGGALWRRSWTGPREADAPEPSDVVLHG